MKELLCNDFGATQENLTLLHANNKGTDQPVHQCSLISAFVIRNIVIIEESLKSYCRDFNLVNVLKL